MAFPLECLDQKEVAIRLLPTRECRHLLPFFADDGAACRLTGSFGDASTGWLGILPSDTIITIVAAMLELGLLATRQEVLASARALHSFVLTCRAAAACVSREQLMEAAARFQMHCTPLPRARRDLAYYDLNLTSLRSTLECRAMLLAIRAGLAHCADMTRTCCRGARETFNRDALRISDAMEGTARGALEREVMGPGRTRIAATVAAGKDSALICQTDRGVGIRLDYHKVVCVEGGLPEVYSAEREVATTFELDVSKDQHSNILRAASAGDLIVFEVVDPSSFHPDAEPKRQLRTFDMRTNTLVDVRDFDYIDYIWVCDDTVLSLWQGLQQMEFEEPVDRVVVRYFQPRAPVGSGAHKLRKFTLPPLLPVQSLKISRLAGHVVMLTAHQAISEEYLTFFDVRLQKLCEIAHFAVEGPGFDPYSIVDISPTGGTIVYIGRALNIPNISVYQRSAVYSNDESLGWRCTHRSFSPDCFMPRPFSRHQNVCAFSPCGGKLCLFFEAPRSGDVFMIDVQGTTAPWVARTEVHTNMWPVIHECSPKLMVWSNDGIYLQTRSSFCGGVVRIGSV